MVLNLDGVTSDIPHIKLIVSHQYGSIYVLLRKKFSNLDDIKFLINCAFSETPVAFIPTFPNKLRSINNMCEKGILFKQRNPDGGLDIDFLI